MRKRRTFLLTVLSDPENASYCGQIKVVGSGKTSNFVNLEDLTRIIPEEMSGESTPELVDPQSTNPTDGLTIRNAISPAPL